MRFDLRGVLTKTTAVGARESQTLLKSVQGVTAWDDIDGERRYSATGIVPVHVRMSVVRLALFKLLGIGVAVAISGIGAATPSLRRSCALAAGVNFVASCYYFLIYKVRSQRFDEPLAPMRVELGREEAEYFREIVSNSNKIFAQEVIVDSLRFSDWIVTLVLMVLDIGWIAEDLNPGGNGLFDGVVYAAFAQVLIVLLGAVPRFLLNDMRRNKAGEWQPLQNNLLGFVCYVLALGLWVVASYDLHLRVGDAGDGPNSTYKYALLFVIWGQIGYPLMFLVQVVWINFWAADLKSWSDKSDAKSFMPPDQYSPLLSLCKDGAYGALDVLSKGGLALLCLVRAAEYDPMATVSVNTTVS